MEGSEGTGASFGPSSGVDGMMRPETSQRKLFGVSENIFHVDIFPILLRVSLAPPAGVVLRWLGYNILKIFIFSKVFLFSVRRET